MQLLADALRLILTGDADVWHVTGVSLFVSGAALVLATCLGVPLGYLLAHARGRAVRITSSLIHTLTALPTVVVGLLLYFALSASGPLGWMDLLYTRVAMIAGQTVLALPIIAALTLVAVQRLPASAHETAATLGLGALTRLRVLLREGRAAIVSALLLAFARVFTELGAAVILGGNIRGETRTLTTVIALEHTKGDDGRAMALGLILLVIALAVNASVHSRWLRGPS
ncbi:MAG: ABC transporter permease [Acidobacteriota bacterium]|nr:ABC transporter permease [Acidobacteriota bacterium]